MKLSENLKRQLFASSPFHGGPRIFEALGDDGDQAVVRCMATGAETLGCALGGLEVAVPGNRWTDASLASFADQASGRIGYLLERLKPIEFDRAHHRVLLRSDRPRKSNDQTSYFELIVGDNRTATLGRFAFTKGTHGRNAVDFMLTPDQLEILIDDLVDICQTTK